MATKRPKEFTIEEFRDFKAYIARRRELDDGQYEYTATFHGREFDSPYTIAIGRCYAKPEEVGHDR